MTPGLLILQRVIDSGTFDAASADHFVRALRRWDLDNADGAALLRYLGVPTTSSKRRQAVRDYWLAAAGDVLGGDTTHERANRLQQALRRFRGTWSQWQKMAAPPPHALPWQGCLFYAMRAGPPPQHRQLQNIISAAFSQGNCCGSDRKFDHHQLNLETT